MCSTPSSDVLFAEIRCAPRRDQMRFSPRSDALLADLARMCSSPRLDALLAEIRCTLRRDQRSSPRSDAPRGDLMCSSPRWSPLHRQQMCPPTSSCRYGVGDSSIAAPSHAQKRSRRTSSIDARACTSWGAAHTHVHLAMNMHDRGAMGMLTYRDDTNHLMMHTNDAPRCGRMCTSRSNMQIS